MTPAPGVRYAVLRHDSTCPAIESQRLRDCQCEAEVELTTQDGWLAAVRLTRRQRREAERAAAKALRRAAQRDRRR